MPGRVGNQSDYRFGFNGMEKDDEVSGSGNAYTSFYRGFDSRIGKWFSTNPVTHAGMSPYNGFDKTTNSLMLAKSRIFNPFLKCAGFASRQSFAVHLNKATLSRSASSAYTNHAVSFV